MSKFVERHIGLITINESKFQEIFNKIFYNLKERNKNFLYNIITFNDTKKVCYDYVIFINNINNNELNFLRYYINYYNTIGIINIDNIDIKLLECFENIITFGKSKLATYQIQDLYFNNNLYLLNINTIYEINELYCKLNNKEDIYFIMAIIILLLNEQYKYNDIKQAIQKVGL